MTIRVEKRCTAWELLLKKDSINKILYLCFVLGINLTICREPVAKFLVPDWGI